MPSYGFFLPSNTIDRHVASSGSPQELRGPQALANTQAMTCKSSFNRQRVDWAAYTSVGPIPRHLARMTRGPSEPRDPHRVWGACATHPPPYTHTHPRPGHGSFQNTPEQAADFVIARVNLSVAFSATKTMAC